MLYGMAESGAIEALVCDGCCENTVTVDYVMTVFYNNVADLWL